MQEEPQDALDVTPEMALKAALKDLSETHKDEPPTKALVLFVWDEGVTYDTAFFNAGMKISEMIALLEIQKYKFSRIMFEG